MNKRITSLCFITLSLLLSTFTYGADKLRVVATFSVLGDLVTQVGGNQIELSTLVGPNGDAHVFQPSPFDTEKVAKADVLVINGLEFEGWIKRIQASSGFKGKLVVATSGINTIHLEDNHEKQAEHEEVHHDDKAHNDDEHGEYDPHAWHSVPNVQIYVENIRSALVQADPARSDFFNKQAKHYQTQLEALELEIRNALKGIPENKRKVITSHDAFGYLAHEYDLQFYAPQGMSTESEASAAEVASIIKQIRKDKIKAVFVENISDSRLIQQIVNETDAEMGGKLYSDALSGVTDNASTYIDMMKHNITTLSVALK